MTDEKIPTEIAERRERRERIEREARAWIEARGKRARELAHYARATAALVNGSGSAIVAARCEPELARAGAGVIAGEARSLLGDLFDPPLGVARPTAGRAVDLVELFVLARIAQSVPSIAPKAFGELADLAAVVARLFPDPAPASEPAAASTHAAPELAR